MSRRHYINSATVTETTGSLTSGALSVTVADASSYPASFPYTAVIDAGTATFEVVLVTAAAGNVLTIERGYDGTAAQSHAANASFSPCAVAMDYDEANDHINATAAHGIAGDVVGTTDTQTLTNKTLTTPVLTTPTINSGATVNGQLDCNNNANVDGNLAVTGTTALTGAVTTTGDLTVGDDLTVTGDATIGGLTGGLTPPGAVTPYAGSAAPTGWILCDGSAVSRSTYAALYAVVGDTFGAGDGSTTFNVPDLRDNFVVGKSGTKALGSTGGAATHTHALDTGFAAIGLGTDHIAVNQNTDGGGVGAPTHKAAITRANATGADATTVSAALNGDSDTASSLPPYLALNYIIKA